MDQSEHCRAIISLLGWILTLVYLTLAAGHKEGEEGIALSSIDRIKTELMIAGFVFYRRVWLCCLREQAAGEWEVAGLLCRIRDHQFSH